MTRSPRSPRAAAAPTAAPLEKLLTLGELAALAQVSVRTLQRHIDQGRLGCVHIGRQIRFRRSDIERWLANTHTDAGRGDDAK
ncbi:helix-turn-helix domain-containing protein [Limobrevibacterium gyesilva]|uniref:helix-turn-helix domain-containing protein n=1 Tax=Limobrevibacterium gyesilva TaxID=2991712 RepID=UPI0038D0C017